MNHPRSMTIIYVAAFATSLFAGCGGGGSGGFGIGPNGQIGPTTTLVGTVATGAPVVGARVAVDCGNGGFPLSGVAPSTGSDGGYTYDITANVFGACHAPYTVSVGGPLLGGLTALKTITAGGVTVNFGIPEAPPSLSSVQPTEVTAGGTQIVNVTPITTVITALLPSRAASAITVSAVSDAKTVVMGALADVLTAAGESPAFDPINSKFAADGTKFDRVLDSVKVDVSPSGISMTNISAAKLDDMASVANGGAPPALPSNAQIGFDKSNFRAALAKPIAGSADDSRILDSLGAALNACFAVRSAQRGNFANPGSACASLATSDYLNDGKDGAGEFDRFLTDPKMDGALAVLPSGIGAIAGVDLSLFKKPEIVRYFTPQRVLVRLSAGRTDGVVVRLRTVAENSAATGNVWRFRGNRRCYLMSVDATADSGSGASTTGLNLYFDAKAGGANDNSAGTQTGVSYVLVRGSGLPSSGAILRPGPGGCDEFFVIAGSLPPAPLQASQACSSRFTLASKASDGKSTDPNASRFGTAPDFAAAPVSDSAIFSTFKRMTAYAFEVHKFNGAVLTFVERLPTRMTELQEIGN